MRSMITIIALIGITIPMYAANLLANTKSKSDTPQLTPREMFAQKYEITFGEKPSDKIWNLGTKNCPTSCQVSCRSCSVGGGRCAGT